MANYDITLTPEAAQVLKEYRISAFIYDDCVLLCDSYAEEGVFLHLVVRFPPDASIAFFEGSDPSQEFLDNYCEEISLPIQFVLYIVSNVRGKHPGFSGHVRVSGKGEAESPSR